MTRRFVWRGILIAVLSAVMAAPAVSQQPHLLSSNSAGGFKKLGDEITIGIVVVSVAVAVVVVLLVLHHKSRKRAITGCVNPSANGMNFTDEKDKRIYLLAGDTSAVKPGDRMTLEGKPRRTGKTFVFESQLVIKDFGTCQP